MATRTWQGVNGDYSDSGNWVEGAAAVATDTITITSGSISTLPTSNKPSAGVFAFTLDTAHNFSVSDFLDAGAVPGDITVDASGQTLTDDIGGSGDITINSGTLELDVTCAPSSVSMAGGILSIGSGVTITSYFAATGGLAQINWSTDGAWSGTFDADERIVMHSNSSSAQITITATSELDLGGVFDGEVIVNGAGEEVTAGNDMEADTFTLTAGTWIDDGHTFVVRTWDATSASGLTTSTGKVTTKGTGTISAVLLARSIYHLEIGSGATTTQTHYVQCKKFSGSGTYDIGAFRLYVMLDAANWWTFTGSLTASTGEIRVYNALYSPGGDIVVDADIGFIATLPNWPEWTHDINLGSNQFRVSANSGVTFEFDFGSTSLTCGSLAFFGMAAGYTGTSTIKLGNGSHSIGDIETLDTRGTYQLDFESALVACSSEANTSDIATITSGNCSITDANGIVIDSTASNSTTWTLDGNTRINGDLTIQQTAGTTTLDLADNDLTVNGDLTHTAGTLTTTNDYGSTLHAPGRTISGVTASKWINVVGATDGGTNTNLLFLPGGSPVSSAGPILGRRR